MCNSFYCSIFICFFLSIFPAIPHEASAADEYYIKPVSFVVNSNKAETLSFPLGKAGKYTLFTLDGNKPRLVIDFPGAIYEGNREQSLAGSHFITGIRSAFHEHPQKKTRVVVDLQPGKKIAHHAVFDDKENILRVVLTAEGAPVVSVKEKDTLVEPVPAKKQEEQKKPAVQPIVQNFDKKEQIAAVPEIRSIAFDAPKPGEERVRFRLNGFYPPKISTKEDEKPQVICEFTDATLLESVKKQMVTGGNLVRQITIKDLAERAVVQVTLDLSEDKDFDLQQVFFRDGNLFVLVVREFAKDSTIE